MDIKELLHTTVKNKGSDLHLLPNIPPVIRVDGSLEYMNQYPKLSEESVEALILSIVTPEQKEILLSNKELDFSIGFKEGTTETMGRFRINAYYQKGVLCGAFRFLPTTIRSIEELNLPKVCHDFAKLKQGFILVTGPTGSGKSTTLAAILNEINQKNPVHILTIEDPIEYLYPKGESIISQREIKTDTHSWPMALRSALREDPDVVLVGEMRDPETIAAAITIAETGHLVFSTLHTNSAAQSIDRMIDSFPAYQQAQVRMQLAFTLKGIISQRLLPQIGGGRVPAVEVLIGTNAVSSNIRDGKTHLIDSIIQTSQEQGMTTLESSLAQLVMSGAVTAEVAREHALHLDDFLHMVKMR